MKKAAALLFILFVVIFYTNFGLRLTLEGVAKVIPGKLVFHGIKGKLVGPLKIDSIHYHYKLKDISVKNVALAWNLFTLFYGKLTINKLHADNISLNLPPAKGGGFTISSPLGLSLYDIKLHNISIRRHGYKKPIIIDKIYLDFAKYYLNLDVLAGNNTLQIHGRRYDLNWHINIPKLQQLFPHVRGELYSSGNVHRTKKEPQIKVMVHGNNIQFGEYKAKKIAGTVNYTGGKVTNISVVSNNITINDYLLKSLRLDGNITRVKKKRFTINAEFLASDKGKIKVAGEVIFNKKFTAKINVTGDNFRALDGNNLKVYLSPKLLLTMINNRVELNGSLLIPRAYIAPDDFSSTDTLPGDVVFVHKKKHHSVPWQIFTNINLELGNNIYVKTMGLKGWVSGNITLMQKPGSVATARGLLTIKNGSYTVFGQPLKVNYGHLNFNGGPVSNPLLNIRTSRSFSGSTSTSAYSLSQQFVVGAQVQGYLNHPKVTLFSDPPGLSHADILSYMILGQPVTQIAENKSQAALLLQAASALNFGGSGGLTGLTESLRKKFGLATFGLGTETTFDEAEHRTTSRTSFMLGKYLSPSLYIGYSLGVLDFQNTFRVRYRFKKNWAVQTETSNIGNGLDLLYSIRRD